MGAFKADTLHVGKLSKNQATVQKIYDRAGWK
jgi:iron(III) transport system substrate-binding protein